MRRHRRCGRTVGRRGSIAAVSVAIADHEAGTVQLADREGDVDHRCAVEASVQRADVLDEQMPGTVGRVGQLVDHRCAPPCAAESHECAAICGELGIVCGDERLADHRPAGADVVADDDVDAGSPTDGDGGRRSPPESACCPRRSQNQLVGNRSDVPGDVAASVDDRFVRSEFSDRPFRHVAGAPRCADGSQGVHGGPGLLDARRLLQGSSTACQLPRRHRCAEPLPTDAQHPADVAPADLKLVLHRMIVESDREDAVRRT